jgi:LmbE family N-acetylglucosaminyl deacetylase
VAEEAPLPSTTVPETPDAAQNILVVVAHPDDCDFGCAGSTARWTSEGRTVSYCIVTDGDAGGSDRSVSRAEMAQIRRREQTAAAAAVGVSEIAFLGYPDGRLAPTIELRRDISRVIRQRKPDRVVTQSPDRNYQRIFASHPDHLAAGEAALSAVYPDARNPFAHMELLDDEGLEPHTVPEVYLMASAPGGVVVDITDTIERKLEALRNHASQYDDWDGLSARVREWARLNAEANGLPEGSSAESFLLVPTG